MPPNMQCNPPSENGHNKLEPDAAARQQHRSALVTMTDVDSSSTDEDEEDDEDGAESVETPPRRPRGGAAAVVTCEEDSDEGSLFQAFEVWKSGFVGFGGATRLRRSSSSSSQQRQQQQKDDNAEQIINTNPPPAAAPLPTYCAYSEQAEPSPLPLAALPETASPLPPPPPPPPPVVLLTPAPPLVVLNSNLGLTPIAEETDSAVFSTATANSAAAPRSISAGTTGTATVLRNKKNKSAGAGAPSAGAAPMAASASACSAAASHNSTTSKNSDRLGMGSFRDEQLGYLAGGGRRRRQRRNPNGDDVDDDDDDMSTSYSFFTRTGAPDSRFREYALDVDPTDGDRAADLLLLSMARPHMRGFHLSWMAFFVSFFTWFAMTPLLSEIARSLDLTRKDIFTSSVLAVVSSAFMRIWIGPLNDMYGARWMMCFTLVAAAIPTALAGLLLQSRTSLYLLRLFIGVAGSSFVTCQFWTVSMFTKEIAGTANAIAAGWGNLGGGVAQVVMGSLLFPLVKIFYGGKCFGTCSDAHFDDDEVHLEYDRPSDLAWRTIMVFPALLSCIMAYVVVRYGDDTPKGNAIYLNAGIQNISHPVPVSPCVNMWANFRKGATNLNTFLLSFQYGCCFGVEIAMTQAAALYFADEFGQSTESAAAIASVFGWMNIFARGMGGFCSDWAHSKSGLRGRLWCQALLLVGEGLLIIIFSFTSTMGGAVAIMAVFSIFLQAAEGSTFGIVPYVDQVVTGSVVGLVGAGGNIGGILFAIIFVFHDYDKSFLWMGCAVVASALLTILVRVPGHRNLFGGADDNSIIERRQNAKPPAIIIIPTPVDNSGESITVQVEDDSAV